MQRWPWWTRTTTGDQHQFPLKKGKGVELKSGNAYAVAVAAVLTTSGSSPPVQATPQPNWLNWNQLNNLIMALLFGGLVFYAISTRSETRNFPPAYSRSRCGR